MMATRLIVFDDRSVFTDGTVALSYSALLDAIRDGKPISALVALPDPRVDRYNSIAKTKIDVAIDDGKMVLPSESAFALPTPDPFASMDLFQELSKSCKSDAHLARLTAEVAEIKKRGMEDLVRFLAWLVSDWRKRKVVWGVGRGSSCASLALHLIGLHRVDPVEFEIPMDEFFR